MCTTYVVFIKHYIDVYNMSCFYQTLYRCVEHVLFLSSLAVFVLTISTIITGEGSCVCRSTALNNGEHITFSIFPRTKIKLCFF